jgi:hypothetical protein
MASSYCRVIAEDPEGKKARSERCIALQADVSILVCYARMHSDSTRASAMKAIDA